MFMLRYVNYLYLQYKNELSTILSTDELEKLSIKEKKKICNKME